MRGELAEYPEPPGDDPIVLYGSYTMRPVEWIWPGRIPRGCPYALRIEVRR